MSKREALTRGRSLSGKVGTGSKGALALGRRHRSGHSTFDSQNPGYLPSVSTP